MWGLLLFLVGQQGGLPPLPIGEYVIYGVDTFRIHRPATDLLPGLRLAPTLTPPDYTPLAQIALTPLEAPVPPQPGLPEGLDLILGVGRSAGQRTPLSGEFRLREGLSWAYGTAHRLSLGSLGRARGELILPLGRGKLYGEGAFRKTRYSAGGVQLELHFYGPGRIRWNGLWEGLNLPTRSTSPPGAFSGSIWTAYGRLEVAWTQQGPFREWELAGRIAGLSFSGKALLAAFTASHAGWFQEFLKYRIALGAAYAPERAHFFPRLHISGTLRLREGLNLMAAARYQPQLPRLYPVAAYLPLNRPVLLQDGDASLRSVFPTRAVELSLGWISVGLRLLVRGSYGRFPLFRPNTLLGLHVEEVEGFQVAWEGALRKPWGAIETGGRWHSLGRAYLVPDLDGFFTAQFNLPWHTSLALQVTALTDSLLHLIPNLWLEKTLETFRIGLSAWNLGHDTRAVPQGFAPWMYTRGRTLGVYVRFQTGRSL